MFFKLNFYYTFFETPFAPILLFELYSALPAAGQMFCSLLQPTLQAFFLLLLPYTVNKRSEKIITFYKINWFTE